MGYRYGMSDINGISMWVSIWNLGYRDGIWVIDMVIHHIDMVILDIDMGYRLMIWEMTVSILSSWISIGDILSLWALPRRRARRAGSGHYVRAHDQIESKS